jgi:ubiquinone/menaquinone biosynthesis C-methylase UbiE
MDKSKFAVDTYDKIADIYTKQYFDDLSDIEYVDKFLNLLPRNANVLDVGSGPGQFSKYIISKGFDVIGIDFSQKMVDIAKEKVSNVTFKQMDMRKLNFENNYFDGLLVAYSLIHIPSTDIHETIDGFHRVLKQNGIIEFITQKGEADKIIDEPFMPSEKMFFNFFTKERITNFLTKANFKIEFLGETDSLDPNSVGDKIIYTIAKKI